MRMVACLSIEGNKKNVFYLTWNEDGFVFVLAVCLYHLVCYHSSFRRPCLGLLAVHVICVFVL